MKETQLALDQKVSVKVQRGKIIIEPAMRKDYSLEELVVGITTGNTHVESDFGKRVRIVGCASEDKSIAHGLGRKPIIQLRSAFPVGSNNTLTAPWISLVTRDRQCNRIDSDKANALPWPHHTFRTGARHGRHP